MITHTHTEIQDQKIFFFSKFLCLSLSLSFHLRTAPTVSIKKKRKSISPVAGVSALPGDRLRFNTVPRDEGAGVRKDLEKEVGDRFRMDLALAPRCSVVCKS